MLAVAATAAAQGPPGVAPPMPADTRWAPPPPLPSAGQPYRPLVPADAPTGGRPPAAGLPTRPVLILQKPAGADEPKAPADQKTDRDPPKAVKTRDGKISKDDLFRLDSEADVLRRISSELLTEQDDRNRAEDAERAKRGDKPEERKPLNPRNYDSPPVDPLVPAGVQYQAKTLSYPGGRTVLEPGYVVHRRLHFEELNSERYGWEVGFAQPAVSTLLFWKDAVLYPAKLASNIGEWYDTSAGKCLPGSPVPYKLYPEPVDAFGILVGTGVVVGGVAILSGL